MSLMYLRGKINHLYSIKGANPNVGTFNRVSYRSLTFVWPLFSPAFDGRSMGVVWVSSILCPSQTVSSFYNESILPEEAVTLHTYNCRQITFITQQVKLKPPFGKDWLICPHQNWIIRLWATYIQTHHKPEIVVN